MPLITEACGYVYGRSQTSIEQINNSTGTVLYWSSPGSVDTVICPHFCGLARTATVGV
jgi:hypothetical protein